MRTYNPRAAYFIGPGPRRQIRARSSSPRPPMTETPEWGEPPPVRRAIRGARQTGPSTRDGRKERIPPSIHDPGSLGRSFVVPRRAILGPDHRAHRYDRIAKEHAWPSRRPHPTRAGPGDSTGRVRRRGPDVESPDRADGLLRSPHRASTARGRGAWRTNDRAMSGRWIVTADCETGPRIARAGAIEPGKPAEPGRIWVRFGGFGVQTPFRRGVGSESRPEERGTR